MLSVGRNSVRRGAVSALEVELLLDGRRLSGGDCRFVGCWVAAGAGAGLGVALSARRIIRPAPGALVVPAR